MIIENREEAKEGLSYPNAGHDSWEMYHQTLYNCSAYYNLQDFDEHDYPVVLKYSITCTFDNSGCYKIIPNEEAVEILKQHQQNVIKKTNKLIKILEV
jgi:hypothetical protein